MSQCKGFTLKGTRCKRVCKNGEFCFNHIPELENKEECCVCLEQTITEDLECKHTICKDCLYSWCLSKKFKANCPLCRTPITPIENEKVKNQALEKRDAIKFYTYSLGDITPEEYSSLRVDIPFNDMMSDVNSEFILRLIRQRNPEVYSRISKKEEIEILDPTCKCAKCTGYRNGTNLLYYSFKRPSFLNDQLSDILDFLDNYLRNISIN